MIYVMKLFDLVLMATNYYIKLYNIDAFRENNAVDFHLKGYKLRFSLLGVSECFDLLFLLNKGI
jgi:hypothetical protein